MADDDDQVKLSVKVPVFSGKKKEWPYFKVKFESYLAQKDMVALLQWEDDVPRDDEEHTAEELETEEVKQRVRIRYLNIKAAGLLLSSIADTDSPQRKNSIQYGVQAY